MQLPVEQVVPSTLPLTPLRQSEAVPQLGGDDDVAVTGTAALACWDQGPTTEVMLVFTGMQETENWSGFESLQAG